MTDTVSQTMTRMNRRHVYPRALGQPCIYCGVRNATIDEHIIAEMFGGRLIFENASCALCASETHAFEGHAGRMFLPIRRQLGIKGKKRSAKERLMQREQRFIVKLDGRSVKIPAAEFPALLVSLTFPLPTILFGLTPTDAPLAGGVQAIELLPGFGARLNEVRRKYQANKVEIVGMVAPNPMRERAIIPLT